MNYNKFQSLCMHLYASTADCRSAFAECDADAEIDADVDVNVDAEVDADVGRCYSNFDDDADGRQHSLLL
jgi:hypothetical protein